MHLEHFFVLLFRNNDFKDLLITSLSTSSVAFILMIGVFLQKIDKHNRPLIQLFIEETYSMFVFIHLLIFILRNRFESDIGWFTKIDKTTLNIIFVLLLFSFEMITEKEELISWRWIGILFLISLSQLPRQRR